MTSSTIYPSSNFNPTLTFVTTDVVTQSDVIKITVDGTQIQMVNNSRLTFAISDGITSAINTFFYVNTSQSNTTVNSYILTSGVGTKASNANVTLTGLTYFSPPST
jgi:hypothetical protein